MKIAIVSFHYYYSLHFEEERKKNNNIRSKYACTAQVVVLLRVWLLSRVVVEQCDIARKCIVGTRTYFFCS